MCSGTPWSPGVPGVQCLKLPCAGGQRVIAARRQTYGSFRAPESEGQPRQPARCGCEPQGLVSSSGEEDDQDSPRRLSEGQLAQWRRLGPSAAGGGSHRGPPWRRTETAGGGDALCPRGDSFSRANSFVFSRGLRRLLSPHEAGQPVSCASDSSTKELNEKCLSVY